MTISSAAELEAWAARALDAAKRAGATQAEVGVSTSRALSVAVRKGEVESVEFQRDRDLNITVFFGQRTGSASTADLSDRGLAATVEAACAIARLTGEDPCQGLADAARMAQAGPSGFVDLDLYHPWAVTPEAAAEIARRAETAAFAVDARVQQSEGAHVDTREGLGVYANSHGFVGSSRSTNHSIACGVIARDDAGMQNGHHYGTARHAADLPAAEGIGAEAGTRALARLGARSLSTRKAPVLLMPEMARGLIGHFLGAISGGALYRKASFLLDRVGTPVFAPHMHLLQDPFIARAAASGHYDSEGVAAERRTLIEAGTLRGYLLGSYSARKMGLRSTGNAGGAFNVLVQGESRSFDELVQQMGTGLVVTGLMGQGINMVTGDYSRGAEGYWVENGVAQFPVEGITIAGNLATMFAGIRAIGTDIDTRGAVRTGSLLLDELTIAGS